MSQCSNCRKKSQLLQLQPQMSQFWPTTIVAIFLKKIWHRYQFGIKLKLTYFHHPCFTSDDEWQSLAPNSANSEKPSSFKCGIKRLFEQGNFSWLASNKPRIFKRHAYLHEVSLVISNVPTKSFYLFPAFITKFSA